MTSLNAGYSNSKVNWKNTDSLIGCRSAAVAAVPNCSDPLSPVSWMIQQTVCSVFSPTSLIQSPFRQLLDTEPTTRHGDLPVSPAFPGASSSVAGGLHLLCACFCLNSAWQIICVALTIHRWCRAVYWQVKGLRHLLWGKNLKVGGFSSCLQYCSMPAAL